MIVFKITLLVTILNSLNANEINPILSINLQWKDIGIQSCDISCINCNYDNDLNIEKCIECVFGYFIYNFKCYKCPHNCDPCIRDSNQW